jgi:hypothetical protein
VFSRSMRRVSETGTAVRKDLPMPWGPMTRLVSGGRARG